MVWKRRCFNQIPLSGAGKPLDGRFPFQSRGFIRYIFDIDKDRRPAAFGIFGAGSAGPAGIIRAVTTFYDINAGILFNKTLLSIQYHTKKRRKIKVFY